MPRNQSTAGPQDAIAVSTITKDNASFGSGRDNIAHSKRQLIQLDKKPEKFPALFFIFLPNFHIPNKKSAISSIGS
ncbi:hypothetical protein HX13_19025 [Chryseobacterium sp. P1-3]|uniref:Uncharacterized protein n=1 Tax=Chryseobacterium gallinarum TaxID=1324352 RepID=A0A0G3M4S7_CHRGL|nr:hypothetical protein OK18_04615 [Chryseobacterium gallinarum]KFF73552.1 hypothetical protein HX13_19025 [Chryseobacterium sp. P1-3]